VIDFAYISAEPPLHGTAIPLASVVNKAHFVAIHDVIRDRRDAGEIIGVDANTDRTISTTGERTKIHY
jgi:hypothetical protein